MAFLDNSGDIILDAVLTDTGRYRLAKGDGSFKIVKFALGDDEINYASYNKQHPSGSAYYDLEILQTPILEAFTNNTSTMKSKLLSIPRTNLLYLPVLKMRDADEFAKHSSGVWIVAVDANTVGLGTTGNGGLITDQAANSDSTLGILNGNNPSDSGGSIRVDQGLDTQDIPWEFTIDADLLETQYIVEIDNRFGSIAGIDGTVQNLSFVDDDNIASYYFSKSVNPTMVGDIAGGVGVTNLKGPRGTKFMFEIQASTELRSSTYLFERLGQASVAIQGKSGSQNCRVIDTIIRVTGATTGYRIDIPIRFAQRII